MQTCRNQRNPKRSPKLFRSLGIQLLVYVLLILSTPPSCLRRCFNSGRGCARVNCGHQCGQCQWRREYDYSGPGIYP